MNRPFRFTRRHAWMFVLVFATLVLSIVFDLTVFATTIFPALWVATLGASRCEPLSVELR